MNEDPKYWEETVLPWIKELKAKQEEARVFMEKLEDVAFHKAGYVKVQGRYVKKEYVSAMTVDEVKRFFIIIDKEEKAVALINRMKERRTV